MEFAFKQLKFGVADGRVAFVRAYESQPDCKEEELPRRYMADAQIAGENHNFTGGARQITSSEWNRLKYVSHSASGNELTVVQRSELVEIRSHFVAYDGTSAIRTYAEIENVSDTEITLEYACVLNIFDIGSPSETKDIYLYRFHNGHHIECQPRRLSFFDLGLFGGRGASQRRITGHNIGSWSTKEELPQAIIEDGIRNTFLMFQIESNNGWYWEIGDDKSRLYLNAGGANQTYGDWAIKLKPRESYKTVCVAFAAEKSLDGVIAEMTKYRRKILRECGADKNLPTIFNEYMHLSWDSPDENRTAALVPEVAKLGIEYYVIDCGWHNEEAGNIIYPSVGQWKESKARFPKGIKHTVDLIHSHGMKAGLWLEPEIIGYLCTEMLAYYPADAYFYRNGKPVTVMGRRFLDFRNKAVADYLNGVIDKLLGEYGVDYLKFDYNQDCGAGTEHNSDSLGDGLQKHAAAYFEWVENIMRKYPDVIIETCSSGGQRMDYKTLSVFPLVSTSDQTRYCNYPYIAGNILSAVLPEQAAVWSYPVDTISKELPDDEKVVVNMINSLLGRMHLASDVSKLTDKQKELVKEGVTYFKSIANDKKRSVPYFPLGFTDFSQQTVAAGFKTDKKLYLAVWNLGGENKVEIPVSQGIKSVAVGYPKNIHLDYSFTETALTVRFSEPFQARFFEIEID